MKKPLEIGSCWHGIKKAKENRNKTSRKFQVTFSRVFKKILFQSFSKLSSSKNTCAGQRQVLTHTVIEHSNQASFLSTAGFILCSLTGNTALTIAWGAQRLDVPLSAFRHRVMLVHNQHVPAWTWGTIIPAQGCQTTLLMPSAPNCIISCLFQPILTSQLQFSPTPALSPKIFLWFT